jgi:hypothetical protein
VKKQEESHLINYVESRTVKKNYEEEKQPMIKEDDAEESYYEDDYK